jgi:L-asparaginase II
LTRTMAQHPEMVAGEGRACTELMLAMAGRTAIKTGAEAVFVAIVPDLGLGIALKITDGGTRAAEAAIAAILCKIGALKVSHFAAQRRLNGDHKNCNGLVTGITRLDEGFISL